MREREYTENHDSIISTWRITILRVHRKLKKTELQRKVASYIHCLVVLSISLAFLTSLDSHNVQMMPYLLNEAFLAKTHNLKHLTCHANSVGTYHYLLLCSHDLPTRFQHPFLFLFSFKFPLFFLFLSFPLFSVLFFDVAKVFSTS